MRTTIILSLTGFGLLALSAPVLADDITIAVAGPMTGPVASIGEQMKRGAEAAAAAINDGGGVDGRKIKIVIEDDACDPKQAVTVANLIVGQQIKYVDGHRLLRLVDPRFRRLCREQRPDDEPGVVEPGADREGACDDHAPLPAGRPAG